MPEAHVRVQISDETWVGICMHELGCMTACRLYIFAKYNTPDGSNQRGHRQTQVDSPIETSE